MLRRAIKMQISTPERNETTPLGLQEIQYDSNRTLKHNKQQQETADSRSGTTAVQID